MLVLTRKAGERLVIGDQVIVTVTELSGGRVKLGIEAPTSIPILRGELTGAELEKVACGASTASEAPRRDHHLRRLRRIPR